MSAGLTMNDAAILAATEAPVGLIVVAVIVLVPFTWCVATLNRRRIRMIFLPDYSPELNPDEYLNHDVKSNGVGRERPADPLDMMECLRSYLRQTQRRPLIVRNYFNHEEVAYAAA